MMKGDTKRGGKGEGANVKNITRTRQRNAGARDDAIRAHALKEFERNFHDPLFVAGLALYWGEGDTTTRYQVRLTNTDPGLLQVYVKFLKAYAPEMKDRLWVAATRYENGSEEQCEKFWQQKTGLKHEQFQKTVIIKSRSIERRSPYGMCTIGISSVALKIKMLTWIAELKKRLYS